MADKPRVVLGCGGHAKVLRAVLRLNRQRVLSSVDRETESRLARLKPSSALLVNGVGARNDARLRREVYERHARRGWVFATLIAPSAVVDRSVALEAGAQVLTRAVVHPGSTLGENCVVNTAAVVEHDCAVGAHAFVGPGALLCGGCRLGEGAFIGAGAVILPGIVVGPGATVGAGAVVTRNVAPGARIAGVPARPVSAPRPAARAGRRRR